MAYFPNPFSVSSLNGSNGFTIQGIAGSQLGYSAANAGDFNGDGINDIIVGAHSANNGAGQAYVIYGGNTIPSLVTLSTLSSSQGFVINGITNSALGISVASAGDVNNDGKDDIIVGASSINSFSGQAYVIYGGKGTTSPLAIWTLTSTQGFTIYGSTGSQLGISVASAGDINGDKIDDIVIGAAATDGVDPAAYVIYGGSSASSMVASNIQQDKGFIIQGRTSSALGGSVASAGDVNGDGKNDVIIGAWIAGEAYVIYGNNNIISPIIVSVLKSSQGFTIQGAGYNYFGRSVASVGDINGDGKDDIMIGAMGVNTGTAILPGNAYVIYGSNNIISPIIISELTSAQGLIINGVARDVGESVASAGDINCDGKTDIIVGATAADNNAGAAYVIYGGSSITATSPIMLSTLNSFQGFAIQGISNSRLGESVASAGDVNGDGKDDIIIGAWYDNNQAGAAYVIYGIGNKPPAPAPNPVPPSPISGQCNYQPNKNVTPYINVLLSLEVYDKSNQALPNDWSILKSSNDPDVPVEAKQGCLGGYFGRAYINPRTGEMIIAHQGTKDFIDLLKDDPQIAFGCVPSQFKAASVFIDYVISYTCNNNVAINYLSFTGHSLGAVLAELSVAKYHYPATTFDSPGSKDIINKMINNFALTSYDLSYADSNVIAYNAAPNMINTANDHVGTIKRVYIFFPNSGKHATIVAVGGLVPLVDFGYYTYYSIAEQHSLSNISAQFNSETGYPKVEGHYKTWPSGTISLSSYTGFSHYRSYDVNTYFWDYYLHPDWREIKTLGDFARNALTFTFIPKEGVEINGDNSGNTVWGTTNFDDIVRTGTGDDIHYLFAGNDYSYDIGGFDTYIYPASNYGMNIIDDRDGVGKIGVGENILKGRAYNIDESHCDQVNIQTTYQISTENLGAFFLRFENNDMLIFNKCNARNNILIKNYVWGNFNITLDSNAPKEVIVGALNNQIDCTKFTDCIAVSTDQDEMILAKLDQTAVLFGNMQGKKIFKIFDTNKITKEFRALSDVQPSTIEIELIKDGDYVDLSNVASIITQDSISQNGTDAFITIGQTLLHLQIMENSNFVNFTAVEKGITITNIDMDQVYNPPESSGGTAPDEESSFMSLLKNPVFIGIAAAGAGLVCACAGVLYARAKGVCCFGENADSYTEMPDLA